MQPGLVPSRTTCGPLTVFRGPFSYIVCMALFVKGCEYRNWFFRNSNAGSRKKKVYSSTEEVTYPTRSKVRPSRQGTYGISIFYIQILYRIGIFSTVRRFCSFKTSRENLPSTAGKYRGGRRQHDLERHTQCHAQEECNRIFL